MYHEITSQARTVVTELLEQANLRSSNLFCHRLRSHKPCF